MSLNTAGALAMTDQQVSGGIRTSYQWKRQACEVAVQGMRENINFSLIFHSLLAAQPLCNTSKLQKRMFAKRKMTRRHK